MSSRLSPFDTASLCSWPSLSMKVTHSSSPGFGGSTWPCLVDGVEENDRTGIEGAAGRMARVETREVEEEASALGDIIGLVFTVPKRRTPCVVVVGVVEGLRRKKARANDRGVAMAWVKSRSSRWRKEERSWRSRERYNREEGRAVGFLVSNM